jgi:CHAT domain-containing protein
MSYIELQVTIEDNTRVRVVTERGAEASGKFRLTPLFRDLIDVFDFWVREKKITRREEMKALGALLYTSLFDGDTDQLFKKTLDGIQNPDRLRLQLVFNQEAFDLASIPWEFLYRPDRENSLGFFLATQTRLVLSRYIPLEWNRESLSIKDEKLRFMVVISKPKYTADDLGPVLEYPVVEVIEELSEAQGFDLFRLENPTIEEFLENLEKQDPHILHFIGHGRYVPDQKRGEIALLKADRETAQWVTDTTFADYFDSVKPRLVLLHACEGAHIDFSNKFAGLAPQLIHKRIPAVVAMQYEVTNEVAIRFSKTFYRLLAAGQPIDGAVQEGRRQITLSDPNAYSNRDFGTPVLYMRSRDGLILPPLKH